MPWKWPRVGDSSSTICWSVWNNVLCPSRPRLIIIACRRTVGDCCLKYVNKVHKATLRTGVIPAVTRRSAGSVSHALLPRFPPAYSSATAPRSTRWKWMKKLEETELNGAWTQTNFRSVGTAWDFFFTPLFRGTCVFKSHRQGLSAV